MEKIPLKLYIVVLSGLPMTGKTTLARALVEKTNLVLLDVDEIRQREFPNPERKILPKEKELAIMIASYKKLGRQAELLLASGQSVILAGTFSRAVFKEPLKILKEKFSNIPMHVFLLKADNKEIEERIDARNNSNNPSNITSMDSFQWVASHFEKIDFTDLVEIDTTKSVGFCVQQVLENISLALAR